MEKQQLSVDDDPLPIYYVHPDAGRQAFSSAWQGQEASASLTSCNGLSPFTENCLPPTPSRTENPLLNTSKYKTQDEAKNPGTNADICFSKRDYSAVHNATQMKTQVSTSSTSSSAQDVFLSSLLQVQLCVMDLQDQIDISETSHKAREMKQNINPPPIWEPVRSGSPVQDSQIGLTTVQSVVGDLEHQDQEEDQESDDEAYSELEEDEVLFCDNPLFKNSNLDDSHQPTGHTIHSVPAMKPNSSPSENIVIQTSQLLKPNVWNSSDMGTRTAVWHQITREESLEELQIYEDEWEERTVLFSRVSTSERLAFNSVASTHETSQCLEISKDSSLPDVPVVSPRHEVSVEETGLLFSECSYWTKLLIEDEEPDHQDQPSHHQPFTSLTQEEPGEDILPEPCLDESPQKVIPPKPDQDESSREDILLKPFLDKSPQEDILSVPCQNESLRENILPEHCQNKSLRENILPEHCQNESLRENILPEHCQSESPHAVCQGCQGKEHGIQMLPPENAIHENNTPKFVIDILDDVSTDLETSGSEEATYVEAVASSQDVEAARCLAVKLFHLDGFDRSQVAPYLQKNNDFSAMVAEEYLALFDFTGRSLDVALRSLLKELVLTGETQERERVLYHFSKRFHTCNPQEFSSADAVHTLTCAIMLLNSDLHGQNIGKSMTTQDFITNLEGMNDGGNFPRELLKALYHSIRMDKLEWAVSEERLGNVLVPRPENLLSVRKKSNPFVDIPSPDPQAPVYKQGLLCRKIHAAIDGKKTPWGKRSWKSFHIVLKGMLLFSFKGEYRADFQFPEEVISIHHALAERASEYTKRPNVLRLQTADWRVFLFQAQTSEEMNSWISRINLVAAMFSSPPFPSAVGSQKKFYRPILPSAPSKLDLEEQLQSHEALMDRFTDDLTEHQRNIPDPKSKSRDWEDYHLREEYLRYEKLRYETYVKLLAVRMESSCEDLQVFESRLTQPDGVEGENGGLKRSYSSPSLNPENSPLVKVKRNISERRTYRRIIPKRNKNLV